MNVTVYTRHRATCAHSGDRAWKTCACPKWLCWHVNNKQHRKTAKTGAWATAAKLARQVEKAHEGRLRGDIAGVTVAGAVAAFLTDRESQHLQPSTMSKLRTIFDRQMLVWFNDLGITLLRDVQLPDLQKWRGSWTDGPLAAKKKQERVRGFFWFCFRNKWITDNPALGLSRIKADLRPAVPLSDSEYSSLVLACSKFGKTEEQRKRVRAIIMLMRWSGLAIRDATCLERAQLGKDDRLMLRRAKTGIPVMVPLQPNVASMLRALPSDNPRYFFWSGKGSRKTAASVMQQALKRVFDLAALKHPDGAAKHGHPHQLRHTFSVGLLLSGMAIEDVARLLGHSSVKTTERYYSAWIEARAVRLEEGVRAAWVSKG